MTAQQTLDRFRAVANDEGWNVFALAREIGCHQNTLRRLHEEGWTPSFDTLEKMEQFLEGREDAA